METEEIVASSSRLRAHYLDALERYMKELEQVERRAQFARMLRNPPAVSAPPPGPLAPLLASREKSALVAVASALTGLTHWCVAPVRGHATLVPTLVVSGVAGLSVVVLLLSAAGAERRGGALPQGLFAVGSALASLLAVAGSVCGFWATHGSVPSLTWLVPGLTTSLWVGVLAYRLQKNVDDQLRALDAQRAEPRHRLALAALEHELRSHEPPAVPAPQAAPSVPSDRPIEKRANGTHRGGSHVSA